MDCVEIHSLVPVSCNGGNQNAEAVEYKADQLRSFVDAVNLGVPPSAQTAADRLLWPRCSAGVKLTAKLRAAEPRQELLQFRCRRGVRSA